jgi:cystathionine beta-lyase
MFDFDTLPERRGTASLKWDFGARIAGREDLLPLWVADMDFVAPPFITEAVARRAAHGVFGYTLEPESYFEAAIGWLARRHGWAVPRPWLVPARGGAGDLRRDRRCAAGDRRHPATRLLPFALRIRANRPGVVENPLVLGGRRYRMDVHRARWPMAPGAGVLQPHNPRQPRGPAMSPQAACAPRAVIVSDGSRPRARRAARPRLDLAEAARITVTCVSATKT